MFLPLCPVPIIHPGSLLWKCSPLSPKVTDAYDKRTNLPRLFPCPHSSSNLSTFYPSFLSFCVVSAVAMELVYGYYGVLRSGLVLLTVSFAGIGQECISWGLRRSCVSGGFRLTFETYIMLLKSGVAQRQRQKLWKLLQYSIGVGFILYQSGLDSKLTFPIPLFSLQDKNKVNHKNNHLKVSQGCCCYSEASNPNKQWHVAGLCNALWGNK